MTENLESRLDDLHNKVIELQNLSHLQQNTIGTLLDITEALKKKNDEQDAKLELLRLISKGELPQQLKNMFYNLK